MNAFLIVANLQAGNHPYLGSKAFRDRIEMTGETGRIDKVNVQCALLQRIALCPHELPNTLKQLDNGVAHLQFFGYSNPLPMFLIEVGSPEFEKLRGAVLENVNSPKFDAAKRVRKWRGQSHGNHRRTSILVDRFSASLDWGSRELPESESAAKREASSLELQAYIAKLRTLRSKRLNCLSRAACGTYGYTDLLTEVALEAMPA